MNAHPTQLELAPGGELRITWSDGHRREHTAVELRENCPCATCREKRSAPPPPATELPVIQPSEAAPLKILAMQPVGHYAYSVDFSDGHNTGIYTFKLLRQLGREID